MAFKDWTFRGTGTGTIDPTVKQAGNSSYKALPAYASANELEHNTFLEPRAMVICWTRADYKSSTSINHSSYGTINCTPSGWDVWERQRVTFWYDAQNNIRFGRRERYVGGAWIQVEDVEFGSGTPTAGTIKLMNSTPTGYTKPSWFDEVEVYS